MLNKILHLLFLVFFGGATIAQPEVTVTIKGKVNNLNTKRSVSGVEVNLVVLNADGSPLKPYQSITNNNGEFVFHISYGLPKRLKFSVTDKAFNGKNQDWFRDPNAIVTISVYDSLQVPEARLNNILEDIQAIKGEVKAQPTSSLSVKQQEEFFKEIKLLEDSIIKLLGEVNDGKVSAERANDKLNDLNADYNVLKKKYDIIEEENWQAYLHFEDFHCQGISEDNKTLNFTFRVFDKNFDPVVSKEIELSIQILKISGNLRGNNKGVPILHESNNTEMRILVKPTPFVKISFTAKERDFVNNKSNYTIKVYNARFDRYAKAFIDKELAQLETDCFPEEELEPVAAKENILVKTFSTNSDTVKIELSDESTVDDDKIVLLLNGKPITPVVLLSKKPQIFNIPLLYGYNIITLKSISMGKIYPNTAHIKLIDKQNTYEFSLTEDKNKTQSIKIQRE